MTWTVTKEEPEEAAKIIYEARGKKLGSLLHVRAIIDVDNEQTEIKDLIASLQKHVKEPT